MNSTRSPSNQGVVNNSIMEDNNDAAADIIANDRDNDETSKVLAQADAASGTSSKENASTIFGTNPPVSGHSNNPTQLQQASALEMETKR